MSSRPAIMRRIVDFPQPDGPTRMTNSPSAMSRSTLSTAGASAPGKRLVILSRRMLAMDGAPLRPGGLALDGAGREAGDDPALEDQHQDDDGDGDDHRRGRDGGGRLLEERLAGEEGERRRHGPGPVGGGQRDAEDEVVPGEEEHEDRRRGHARRGEGDDDLAEGLPRR